MSRLIYTHFSVPANFLPFVYLDDFYLTQFCFDEYLSFILTFVPHYFVAHYDVPLLNISINSQVLFFPYKNFIERIKHLHMTITTLVLKYLAPLSFCYNYYFFYIIFFSSIRRHPLMFYKKVCLNFRAPIHY